MTTEASESSPDPERPYWLHGPCPAWCDKIHQDTWDAEERAHFSEWVFDLALTTEDSIVYLGSTGADSSYAPTQLTAYLKQNIREIGPRVVIDPLPKDRARLHLLPTEARRFGEALVRLATLAIESCKRPD